MNNHHKFSNNPSHTGQLLDILEICRDESGHISFDDVEAIALSTGHHSGSDLDFLRCAMDHDNACADMDLESEDWQDGCELGDELGVDPIDFDSAEEYKEAVFDAASDAGIDIDDDSW